MKNKLEIAILGFGNRGSQYCHLLQNQPSVDVKYIIDNNLEALKLANTLFEIEKSKLLLDVNAFFKMGKVCDAVIISTQDKDHYNHTLSAIKLGYKVLLEKPIATNLKDTLKLYKQAKKLSAQIMICHVLRYSLFYDKIKQIINSKSLGNLVSINMTESISYWRYAHSYVRGSWSNSKLSSPMILAKSCHDLDILYMLSGKKCLSLNSYGGQFTFNKNNAPQNSGEHCFDCKIASTCLYNAYKIYKNHPNYIKGNRFLQVDNKDIDKLITQNNSLTKCVYKCSNDVVDRQTVNMLLENNIMAQFTLSPLGFDDERTITIYGDKAMLVGSFAKQQIIISTYGEEIKQIDLEEESKKLGCHGGGDEKMISDFIKFCHKNGERETRSTLDDSIESHIIAFYAEKSRINKGKNIKIRRKKL